MMIAMSLLLLLLLLLMMMMMIVVVCIIISVLDAFAGSTSSQAKLRQYNSVQVQFLVRYTTP